MIGIPKPLRGQHVLDRDEERAQVERAESAAKIAAKKRDRYTCRWPEAHVCRGMLEGAHIFEDKKMGGDHGRLSHSRELMAVCSWIHRRGPHSIHGKQLKVEPETDQGADGPCAFYRRETLLDEWSCVGVETAIHVLRKA